MRPTLIVMGLALAALSACASPTAGAPSSGDLDGHWGWTFNANPSGSYMVITLSTGGFDVSGSGEICGIGPNCAPGAVTISGTHQAPYGVFTLTIRGGGSYVATYVGQFAGPNVLQGTWKQGSDSGQVTFLRCTSQSYC